VSSNQSDYYGSLNKQLAGLLSVERHWLTNISQFSAFLYTNLEDINWAGFYLTQPSGDLLLGPFQGQVACVKIELGKGVCGTAAKTKEIQLVEDVDQFAGHIACDARSRSELVLPVLLDGHCFAVLDIDSPSLARFCQNDADGLTLLLSTLIESSDWPANK
jgi:L-methionine (R)-S-oxide reductase